MLLLARGLFVFRLADRFSSKERARGRLWYSSPVLACPLQDDVTSKLGDIIKVNNMLKTQACCCFTMRLVSDCLCKESWIRLKMEPASTSSLTSSSFSRHSPAGPAKFIAPKYDSTGLLAQFSRLLDFWSSCKYR